MKETGNSLSKPLTDSMRREMKEYGIRSGAGEDCIFESVYAYTSEKKREMMRRGYREMASINLSLSRENSEVDREVAEIFDKFVGELNWLP